jgi:hypothetical protein
LRFRFSKHVLEELARRQIPRTLVEGVLESLEQKNHLLENITCYQSRVEFNTKQYLLRVMVNESVQPPAVVTAYRTDGKSAFNGVCGCVRTAGPKKDSGPQTPAPSVPRCTIDDAY